jgi:hypothetical protein
MVDVHRASPYEFDATAEMAARAVSCTSVRIVTVVRDSPAVVRARVPSVPGWFEGFTLAPPAADLPAPGEPSPKVAPVPIR